MRVQGVPRRSIALADDGWALEIIDQTLLPHRFQIRRLETLEQAFDAIAHMQVRGAPLIGVTAAYGLCLALRKDASDAALAHARELLQSARPTAVNLRWALERLHERLRQLNVSERVERAYSLASALAEADVRCCRALGENGANLLGNIAANRGGRVRVLTHCNAGWLATVDYGTALAPVYVARTRGIEVEVVVEETRPRNQGLLTAWELGEEDVPHVLIADNAGGHLLQHGRIDVCIVGTDRTVRNGDVGNKIGTYLKALAAHDNFVPFYVALPSSSFDPSIATGADIPIEERDGDEVREISGVTADGRLERLKLAPAHVRVENPGFDVTPARLVTGFVTEYGLFEAHEGALLELSKKAKEDEHGLT